MLEGITRRTVMEIGDALGLDPMAVDITKDAFLNADEVFTATTAGGPVPVTRVDGRILGNDAPGKITKDIIAAYWKWHERSDLSLPINYL